MRAFAVRTFDEVPAIYDLPIGATDGAILLRVRYAGALPIDYKLLERLSATSTYLRDRSSRRFVCGVTSLPLGTPVQLSHVHGSVVREASNARTHATQIPVNNDLLEYTKAEELAKAART